MTQTPLSDLSRNLLSAAREGLSPDAAAAERVRARVAAAVGGSAVATAVVTSPAKATAASLPIKLAAVAVVVGVVAAALVVVPRVGDFPAPHVSARAADTDEPRGSVQLSASESSAPPPRAATVAPVAPAAPVASLAREVELIDRAMLALRRGAPVAALDSIALYDRETRGRGQMAEDAAAIAIEAHCTLGHDVGPRLAAFDRAFPSSAQRARLTQACMR